MINQHIPYLKSFVHKAFRRFEVYVGINDRKTKEKIVMHRLTQLIRCRSQYVTTALQCVLRRTGVLPYKHYFSQGSHLSFLSKSSISSSSQRASHAVCCARHSVFTPILSFPTTPSFLQVLLQLVSWGNVWYFQ